MKGFAIPKISSMIIIFVIIASVGIVIVSTNPQITDDVIAGFKNTTLSVFGEQIIDVKKPINLSDTGITYNQTNFNDFLLNGSTNVNDIDAFVKQFNWSAVTQDQVPRLFNVNVIDQRTLTNLSEFRDFRDLSRRVEYLEDTDAVSYGGGNPITIGTGDLRDGAVTGSKLNSDGASVNQVYLYNGTDWIIGNVAASGNYSLDISNTTDEISIADSDNLTFLGTNGISIQLSGKNVTINGSGVATASGVSIPAENITSGTLDDARLSSNVTLFGNSISLPAENITSGTLDDSRLSANITKLGTTIEQSEISGLTLPSANITGLPSSDGTGFNTTNGNYIYGTVPDLYSNDTRLNADFNFTVGGGLNKTGTLFDVNITWFNNIFRTLTTVVTSSYIGSHVHSAENITSGTLDDSRLSGNVSLLGQSISQSEIDGLTIPWGNITSFPGLTMPWANVTGFSIVLEAENITIGTIDDHRLSANVTLFGNSITLPFANVTGYPGVTLPIANITAGTFGAGYTWNGNVISSAYLGSHTIIAENVTSGTLDDARLSANVTKLGDTIEQSELSGITLPVANITGITADGTGFNKTSGNYIYGITDTVYSNDTGLNLSFNFTAGGGLNKTGTLFDVDTSWFDALYRSLTSTVISTYIGSHTHPAENITSGTLDDARLSLNVTLLGSVIEQSELGGLTLPAVNITGGLDANGISLTYANISGVFPSSQLGSHTHSGENITSGTIDDSRLSANITKLGSTVEQSELSGLTIPTVNVSAGTFSAGDFTFPQNLTVTGNITISATVSCIYVPGGGKMCGNSTCTTLYSPDGGTIMESCN